MSEKDCGHEDDDRKILLRRLLFAGVVFLTLAGFAILLVWLILRPSKPQFVLQDVAVLAFNRSTSGDALTASFQTTIASRNPNDRVGIYYDRLDAYAAYRRQHITLPTLLPSPAYQGHRDVTVWSPFLNGDGAPLSPYLAVTLNQDEIAGAVMVNVMVKGSIRWKIGTFVTGTYNLDVNCPAFINPGGQGDGVKSPADLQCHVDVGPK